MLLRSLRAHRNTPWQFTDLDRFQYPLAGDIDDRHIVGQTVGDQQKFFVGSESTMPDPLSDKEVFDNFVRRSVDHCNPVGGSKMHKAKFAVAGNVNTNRL